MANHRHFDADSVVESAMQQFWDHGFARTSVDDLVRRTGISRSSLYATFGSKESLFEHSLLRYDQTMRRREFARLEQRDGAVSAIHALFDGWVRRARETGDSRGCLLVNTATELRGDCPRLRALVARTQCDTEAFFQRMLERAQRERALPATLDARQTARALLAALLGLLVLVRTRPDPELLDSVASSALAMLRPRPANRP